MRFTLKFYGVLHEDAKLKIQFVHIFCTSKTTRPMSFSFKITKKLIAKPKHLSDKNGLNLIT